MGISINYPFTEPANYTFDSSLVEVVDGARRVINFKPAIIPNEESANLLSFTTPYSTR